MSNGNAAEMIVVSARADTGFFRLGRHWPKTGATVSSGDFTEEEMEILLSDKNLHVELAPDTDAEPDPAELEKALKAAFGKLTADDFTQGGKPKITALRKLLPLDGKGVTQALVEDLWAKMQASAAD